MPAKPPEPVALVDEGEERATLVLRRLLRHPPEVVWQAITQPEQIRRWQLTTATVDGRVGGRVDLVIGEAQVHAAGRILRWDPPRVFEHEWNTSRTGSAHLDEQSVVRWELSPNEGGTLLVLTHRGLRRSTAQVFRHGLPGFIDRLEAQLDGRELPDWDAAVRDSRRGNP
jgi:uncharacterized protein YndB with AHSA1/START domain